MLCRRICFKWAFGMLIYAVISASPFSAQTANPVPTSLAEESRIPSNPVRISAGDLLQISVFGHPELSQQVRVGNDGSAQLTLLGQVALAGSTAEDATTLIADQLRERSILLHPQVTVDITESATQKVSVIGEVQHPGVYPMTSTRSLWDVLSLGGGLTNTAGSHVQIKRHSGEGTISIALKGGDPSALSLDDAVVHPGDSVIVPRVGIVYALGDVARPGGFVMKDNGTITLLQVMAEAGGLLRTAESGHLRVLRKDNGNYQVIKELDWGKITRGKEADMELQAGDIVFVPNSRLKNAFRTSGSLASTIATAAIYGAML